MSLLALRRWRTQPSPRVPVTASPADEGEWLGAQRPLSSRVWGNQADFCQNWCVIRTKTWWRLLLSERFYMKLHGWGGSGTWHRCRASGWPGGSSGCAAARVSATSDAVVPETPDISSPLWRNRRGFLLVAAEQLQIFRSRRVWDQIRKKEIR